MPVPVIAIVGRPNVGKSSLLNWLAGRRIAIVDPTAGVTRDRVDALVKLDDRFVEVVDTGGMGIHDVDDLTAEIEHQIDLAIDKANVIIFLVDAQTGVVPLDQTVAQRLRPVKKPILCVANKADTPALEDHSADFYQLSYGKPIPVSALHNRGKEELLQALVKVLPANDSSGPDPAAEPLKLAIVGRRNTGKSTFINCLAEGERMIVSEVPGTTRDSVDVRFERDGKAIIAIDTAGVRRKRSVKEDIEFYSLARAQRSIRRADVVLHFFDATSKISKVDKTLADYVLEQSKPVIFVVNKWDLLLPMPTGKFADYLYKMFPMLDFVPTAFVTAKTGRNINPLVSLAQNLHKQASARVGTSEMNRVLREAMQSQSPPVKQNRRPKVFYGTQVAANPPTIVLFTNGPELFSNTYQRYLLSTFRDHLPFKDVPIKMYLRNKNREEGAPTDILPDREAVRPGTRNKPKKTEPVRNQSVRPGTKKRPKKTETGRRIKPAMKPKPAKASESDLWDDV